MTSSTFSSTHVELFNAAMSFTQVSPNRSLHVHPLDPLTLVVVLYTDSSFANNDDHSTQLGYIVFLTDASAREIPIYFSS